MKMIILILCGLFLAGAQTFAHAPSDIKAEFDPTTKLLTAIIEHPVSDTTTHYVQKVAIGLNGDLIQTLVFKNQDANSEQVIAFPVPEAQSGDVLSIESYCSKSGTLKTEITVA